MPLRLRRGEVTTEIIAPKLLKHPVLDKDFYKELVDLNSVYLSYVPGDCLDRKMCEIAIEKCEKGQMDIVLDAIPYHIMNKDLLWRAFEKDPQTLERINTRYWTPEILTDAVLRNSWSLFLIKDDFLTEDLCKLALKNAKSDWACMEIYKHVPKKFKKASLYNAIKNNPYAISILPKRYQNYDQYVKAVQTDCTLLKFVPEEMKDENLLKIAVSKDFRVLCAIPKEKQTKELAYLAVDQNPEALSYLHSSLWTTHLFKRIAKNTPEGIAAISLYFMKESVFKYALKIHGEDTLKELNNPDMNSILQKYGIEPKKVEITHIELLNQIKETYFQVSPARKP